MIDQINLSSEDKLLLCCARTKMNENINKIVREILIDPLNWDYILENSLRHGIQLLLYNNLNKINCGKYVPEKAMTVLRRSYYENVSRNMFFYHELNTVLKAFKDAGIDVIILKGAALAEIVYHDISLRGFNDVDILVQKKDLQKAKNTAIAAGYTLDKSCSPEELSESLGYNLHYVKDIILEIHWNIARKTYNERYTKIEIDELWKNAVSVKIANADTMVLSPEDLLLHLCIHIAGHYYGRLIWFCDISEIIECYDINWERLIKNGKKYRAEAYMYYGLQFTSELLDVEVPARVLQEIKPNNFETKLFCSIPMDIVSMNKKNVLLQINPLFKLPLIDRNQDRLNYLYAYIFPPVELLARKYSVSGKKVYFYYIIHPLYIFFKAAKRLVI